MRATVHGRTTGGWLLLLFTLVVLVAGCASPARADGKPTRDPQPGPHAREEALHASSARALRPAQTAVELRSQASAPRLAAAPARTGLNREGFGFAPYWQLPDPS